MPSQNIGNWHSKIPVTPDCRHKINANAANRRRVTARMGLFKFKKTSRRQRPHRNAEKLSRFDLPMPSTTKSRSPKLEPLSPSYCQATPRRRLTGSNMMHHFSTLPSRCFTLEHIGTTFSLRIWYYLMNRYSYARMFLCTCSVTMV